MEQFIKDHCRDNDKYPLVFTKDLGIDITIPNHPELVVRALQNPVAKIKISTFRGISWDAVHYYGKIYADGPELREIQSDGSECSIVGYICKEYNEMSDEQKNLIKGRFTIEIVRPLTQEEIDKDPKRWEMYEAGSKTNGFYHKQDIINIATKIIEYRFPGWKIEIDDCC